MVPPRCSNEKDTRARLTICAEANLLGLFLDVNTTGAWCWEDTIAMDDRAVIRWRFNFRDGGLIRGINLMHVRDGRIVEALGYAKSAGQSTPLPE
jgi:hypothetical protein